MTTVRQMERLWNGGQHTRLFRELISARPERDLRLEMELDNPVGTAALALIRLDELTQSHVPLYARLLRTVLAAQEADGGWGDLAITALCLRALLTGRGEGLAIDHGLIYLANLQKTEGIWPNVPMRRMPADPYVSAFILYQLGHSPRFRRSVRFFDALNWFENHDASMDAPTRDLWRRAAVRCQTHAAPSEPALIWS